MAVCKIASGKRPNYEFRALLLAGPSVQAVLIDAVQVVQNLEHGVRNPAPQHARPSLLSTAFSTVRPTRTEDRAQKSGKRRCPLEQVMVTTATLMLVLLPPRNSTAE